MQDRVGGGKDLKRIKQFKTPLARRKKRLQINRYILVKTMGTQIG